MLLVYFSALQSELKSRTSETSAVQYMLGPAGLTFKSEDLKEQETLFDLIDTYIRDAKTRKAYS